MSRETRFWALPDRGPNANPYNSLIARLVYRAVSQGPVLGANGITPDQIPANDNDFLQNYGGVAGSNPNQFLVFGFTDADLA